jgi:hypothetical protein
MTAAAPQNATSHRRREVLLVAILALVVAAAWFVWSRPAGFGSPASNQAAAVVDPGSLRLPEPVKLEALDALPADEDVGRNPFAFGARPAPPPPVLPKAPPVPMGPPPPPPPPPGPPPINLRVLAMVRVEAQGRVLVTLAEPSAGDPSRTAVFQGFEGDVIDGRYRLVKVGQQSVVVSYLDGSGARTISLGS